MAFSGGELLAVHAESLGTAAAIWRRIESDDLFVVLLLESEGDMGSQLADAEENLRFFAKQSAADEIAAAASGMLSLGGFDSKQIASALCADNWFSGAVELVNGIKIKNKTPSWSPPVDFVLIFAGIWHRVDSAAKDQSVISRAARQRHNWFTRDSQLKKVSAAMDFTRRGG
jgi:hypothetical protein